MSTTLERPPKSAAIATKEWSIYPTGTGTYACGTPAGQVLYDGQALEIYLAGHWVAGRIECHPYTASHFVARDQSTCGLCPGMRIRLYDPTRSK